MKKLILLLLPAVLTSIGLEAQTTVQIGTGTSTPGNTLYSPVYRFSATSTTTTAQSNIIFTAAEMATAAIPTGATITAVAFNKTTAANFVTPATYTMLMGNTSNTAPLPGTIATQWPTILTTHTQVYTSSSFNIPAVIGWATITLTTPFVYTGGALEIATDMVMGGNGAANGNFAWEYTPGFDGHIIGAVTGNSNLATYKQRPNIKITYTSGPPCNAPTGAAVTGITTTSANMNWGTVTGATGYQVAVNTSSTPPASGTANAGTSYTPPPLTPATNYYFHLRTVCGTGFSSWVTVPFTTLSVPPPCAATTAPVITNIQPTSATATWTAAAGSTGYEYFVSTSSTPPASGNAIPGLTYPITGLTAGTQYYFHVRSACTGGIFSSWSTTSFSTPCPAITGLNVSNISFNGATLSWTAVPGSAGYQWVATTSPTPPASGATASAPTANATGLSGGTTYYVHVRNNCGAAGFSPWVTTTFTTTSSCTPPSNILVTNIGPTGAHIQWDPVPGSVGFEYVVDNVPLSPTVAGSPIAFNSYTPANLLSATRYYVHIRTNCGPGGFSPWVTVQFTTDTLCFAPVAVIDDITGTTARISWQPEVNAVNYQYLVSANIVPPFSGYATTATNYNAKGLQKNTQYYFHLRAYCGGNDISSWRSTGFVTNEQATGITSVNEDKFVTVYPNPVTDILTIKLSDANRKDGVVTVADITGRVLRSVTLLSVENQIDMRGLPAGVYLVRYKDSDHDNNFKIIKQ